MVTSKSTTLTNTSSNTIDLTINVTKDWDDFSFGFLPGSTCPTFEPAPLGPDESCVFAVRFWPSEQSLGLKQDQPSSQRRRTHSPARSWTPIRSSSSAEPRDGDSRTPPVPTNVHLDERSLAGLALMAQDLARPR
jgi:hypothetical protein